MRNSSISRGGVTLIELLITMTIMAIIAAAILGVAASAIESARDKRTRSIITKIDTLIAEKYGSYETRRVDFNQYINAALDGITDPKIRGKALADMRLLGMRELQQMEMPDRWTDVAKTPLVLANRPGLSSSYFGRWKSANPSTNNQGAECLYLTVMWATGDGEARGMFSPDQIGDTDEDGAKEFIDGWGNPISWLRWPTGYAPSNLMPGTDSDPNDPYARDIPKSGRLAGHFPRPGYPANVNAVLNAMEARDGGAFRVMPLIFSVGPDDQQQVTSKGDDYVADLDPFSAVETNQEEDDGVLPGTVHADRAKNDITNHTLDY